MSNTDNPLTDFSGCHVGIIKNFEDLKYLLEIIDDPAKAKEVKKVAKKLVQFFKDVVLEHHAEEENELFNAVLDSLDDSDDSMKAKQYIEQLVSEHRRLEGLWSMVESDIKKLSKGKTVSLDVATMETLATEYLAHAKFEEDYFLPLSEIILSKNGLSALGLSLHMRREDSHISSYI